MMSRILIVDDDVAMCRMLMMLVRSYGHDVDCTTEPQDVLERVTTGRPDLVILDVHMPRMSGIDVLRQLKAEAATATIPVVMFSAAEGDAQRDEARALDYWLKSGSQLATLEARINACLRDARRSDA